MGKRASEGFTLIELLIVVAIIATLVGMLIPVFQGALQKAKQKGTMADITSLSKAIMSYATDMGYCPTSPDGSLDPGDQIISDLAPFHVAAFSTRDQWGSPLQVWTRASVAGHFGIEAAGIGPDDFLVQSFGRDGADEGFVFDSSNVENSFYLISSMLDFNRDLIVWNGNWIHAPKHADMSQ